MKKLLSALLVALMLISMLAGCSANELGYLKLAKEISSLTQYGFDNVTSLEISKEVAGQIYNVDFEIKGEVNMDNLNDSYGDMEIKFKINDTKIENPINIKFADNKLYISKNAVIEIIKIEKMLNGNEEYAKIAEAVYNNDLKDIDYLVYDGLSNDFTEIFDKEISTTPLYEDAYEYLTKAFEGFDTKLIKKLSNGYSFELTTRNSLEFIEGLASYISENKERVFTETINYLESFYSILGQEISKEEIEETLAELENSRQDFYDFVDEAAIYVQESEDIKLAASMFENSFIKTERYKQGALYKEVIDAEIVYENENMGKLKSASTLTPKNVKKLSVTGNTLGTDDLERLYKSEEDKINPIQKVEFRWNEGSSYAEVERYRLNGSTELDYPSIIIIEGRTYLPLRYIGESFGEEVDWDNINKKAYITRGQDRIDMTGVLSDSRTMVEIRDFEKLGYKIDYIQENDRSLATIIK